MAFFGNATAVDPNTIENYLTPAGLTDAQRARMEQSLSIYKSVLSDYELLKRNAESSMKQYQKELNEGRTFIEAITGDNSRIDKLNTNIAKERAKISEYDKQIQDVKTKITETESQLQQGQ